MKQLDAVDKLAEIKKILKDYYLYMRYHETAADTKVSHTTAKTSITNAVELENATANAIMKIVREAKLAELLVEARLDEIRQNFGDVNRFWEDSPKMTPMIARREVFERKSQLEKQLEALHKGSK